MATPNHDTLAEQKAMAERYAQMLHDRHRHLIGQLTKKQVEFLQYTYNSIYYELEAAMREPDAMPSEYIRKHMSFILDKVVPSTQHDMLLSMLDRLREYPYGTDYVRRSYRSCSFAPYTREIVHYLRTFFRAHLPDLPLEQFFDRTLPPEVQAMYDLDSGLWGGYIDLQVAYELDRGNPAVEASIRRLLCEENGTGAVTPQLVRGILRSHRSEFHELLGKLLLAAKLQEGLRQVICENADCGTREGFLTLVRVIEENNLIRYSAVKRAVGTWLGLISDDVRDLERVSDKSVRLILSDLTDLSARRVAMASEDAMELYIALWSYAFENVEDAFAIIRRLSQNGTHHQVLTAGYFAAQLDKASLAHRTALEVVTAHSAEPDVLALWLPLVLPNRGWLCIAHDGKQPARWQDYFASADDAYDLAALMERLLRDFTGKTKTFSPCVFPWYEAKIAKADFAEVYCTVAAILKTAALVDNACLLLKECTGDSRWKLFKALLSNPHGNIQRRTVLESIADKESFTRRNAADTAKKMRLTAEEYAILEPLLRFKSPEVRTVVIDLLLQQDNAALCASVNRLLDGDKEELRLGGLDILTRLKADSKRISLVDAFIPRLHARLEEDHVPAKESILLETLVPRDVATSDTPAPLYELGDTYLPDVTDDELLPDGLAEATEAALPVLRRYFPDTELPGLITGQGKRTGLFRMIKESLLGKDFCAAVKEAREDLIDLSRCLEAHRSTRVTDINYSGEEVLLGEMRYGFYYNAEKAESIPGYSLWDAWASERNMTPERLWRMYILSLAPSVKTGFETEIDPYIRVICGPGFESAVPLPHNSWLVEIAKYLCIKCVPRDDMEKLSLLIGLWFMRCVPDDMVMLDARTTAVHSHNCMAHMLTHPQLYALYEPITCTRSSLLAATFPVAVAVAERCLKTYEALPIQETSAMGIYTVNRGDRRVLQEPHDQRCDGRTRLIGVEEYIIAAQRGIITEAEFFEFALRPTAIAQALNLLTSISAELHDAGRLITDHSDRIGHKSVWRKRALHDLIRHDGAPTEEDTALLTFADHLTETILPVVLETEYKRGDSAATYSGGILSVNRVIGCAHFARILESLGSDTLTPGYFYSQTDHVPDRRTTLTHLLSISLPASNETAEDLKIALSGKKITEKRLFEAALYAPEWISLIGNYLGIVAFESVCYYFIAHMNEKFDDKRRAVIARYTPLTEDELNLGAFDRTWFESAYTAVGETNFERIYAAAKYITEGARHTRARKYADACLGKYTADEMEKTISDKRNKDLLMAYALLPSTGEDDICRRYLYIGAFRKESKKFGSQRVASEAKAVEMALKNLALTAGYTDTMRLTLRMETKLMDDNRALLGPHEIDGVILEPIIGEDGKTEITVTKDGKVLKSIPAKLKKHETVLALTELKKALTEQYRRTRLMLEEAMETGTPFTASEITVLFEHPVVKPLLEKLVFLADSTHGFPTATGLRDASGTEHPLNPDETLIIAHPYHLFERGIWRDYQTCLFKYRTVQPFRQVFRELYVKTNDELGQDHSLRYAGHQLAPAKTVSALKSRRWLANVENGLQKVYYKENIVAQMYALADWFTPADIEAPTLEWVCFADRRTGRPLLIDDIPPVIFSEVMRDVDLAVSVAHVGGVDPEASHSTVDMRAAILTHLLPLFGLSNVRIERDRAHIDGTLGDYTVHLGSGVVHRLGGGMIPVLPVHSQHRGQIFLPFVDDDPKTAEIISKVLLFAKDQTIKDPSIVAEIRRFS